MAVRKNIRRTSSVKRRASRNAYLTKRILIRAARNGIKHAYEETLNTMGFTVIAHKGRIVRRYSNGDMEDLGAIEKGRRSAKTILLD